MSTYVWDTPSGYSPYEGSALEHLSTQPHYVYEIYSPVGLCLYVGMTANIKRRTSEQRRRFGAAVTVRSTTVSDRLAAERLECELIRSLEPAANVRGAA